MKTIRRCEIVTNLNDGDNILFDLENMKEVIRTKDCIKDYSYIIHDNDRYTEDDEEKNPNHKCGNLKSAHVHLLLRFEPDQPQQLEYVAKWFGIAPNFICRIKGRWEDACLYQIHKNAPDKYQYDIDDVECNFNYQQIVEKAEKKKSINSILERILSGEIREYNKTLEIDNMMLITNAKLINEAFKVRSERLQATCKDRNMDCIFIAGGSGIGKTTFAKEIARKKGLDFYVSSGSNDILDSYRNEPCIILDDIRPSCLGLSDLLKMLDNHTASSVKSRYRNKFLDCDLIILTSILDIDTFYKNVFAENDEPIIQLKRRCKTYIRMDKDTIYISIWDDTKQSYSRPLVYKNNILEKFIPLKEDNSVNISDRITNLIPFLEPKEKDHFEDVTVNEQLKIPFIEN